MQKRILGNKYESLVCSYLESTGMEIIDRNFTIQGGEIDIIAKDKEYICFVEVKFRTKGNYDAYTTVGIKKQRRIIKTAERYLLNSSVNLQPRFDVAFVFDYGGKVSIEYIKNAYDASER